MAFFISMSGDSAPHVVLWYEIAAPISYQESRLADGACGQWRRLRYGTRLLQQEEKNSRINKNKLRKKAVSMFF